MSKITVGLTPPSVFRFGANNKYIEGKRNTTLSLKLHVSMTELITPYQVSRLSFARMSTIATSDSTSLTHIKLFD